jgi:hypothetical protein
VAQLTRALDQIASLPTTPALRREQIKLQVALITPLIHVKGYPAAKSAAERARLLIEQAEALGEPPEDPLLLFSVLFCFWAANQVVPFESLGMKRLDAKRLQEIVLQPYAAFFCFSFQQILATRSRRFHSEIIRCLGSQNAVRGHHQTSAH